MKINQLYEINNQLLNKRERSGVYDTSSLIIDPEALTRLLIMEVPML